MINLTETQLLVLSAARRHKSGFATRPDGLNFPTATKIGAKFIALGYVRECVTKADQPVWRKATDGKAYSLKILKAGRLALAEHRVRGKTEKPKAVTQSLAAGRQPNGALYAPRPASKIAEMVGLLERKNGATTSEMISATGWLPHTLRACLTGLRKRGYAVERFQGKDGTAAYRISTPLVAA